MMKKRCWWISDFSLLLLLVGWVGFLFTACTEEELPQPQPTPSEETSYTPIALHFVAAEGRNTTEKSYGFAVYFNAYAHRTDLSDFDLYAPFYGWFESRVLPEPTLQLTPIASEATALHLVVQSANADDVRWLCIEAGETASAERILSQGRRVEINCSADVVVENLNPQTSYTIVAAASSRYHQVVAEPLMMTTASSFEQTRRFEDVKPEEPEEEIEGDLLETQLQFLPEYYLDGSGYAYFSIQKNIEVVENKEFSDLRYDFWTGLFGLVAPAPLFEDRNDNYYEFRILFFQPSTGKYYQTPWHRLDLGPRVSVISQKESNKE